MGQADAYLSCSWAVHKGGLCTSLCLFPGQRFLSSVARQTISNQLLRGNR